MVLREMTQLGNDDEERRAYELWDQYQDDCEWEAYDHHDYVDECNVTLEVEGFKFEGYGLKGLYGSYQEFESVDCTLPSGRVINVYPGNHPGIAPEANNETNDNTMANKVSMNEAQLRDKVYKMVCESFEALMTEGKTFKDQKSWGNKGFQKQNKFQKTDKYKNWKNGGNMNSDTDECMNEGVDEGFGDRLRGAVQGFSQGQQVMNGYQRDASGNANRYQTLVNGINNALAALKGGDMQLAQRQLMTALNVSQNNVAMNTPGTMAPYSF